MHLELPLGSDVDFLRVISDLVCSLRPLAEQHNVSLEELGGLDTLPDRSLCRDCGSEHCGKYRPATWGLVTQAGHDRESAE